MNLVRTGALALLLASSAAASDILGLFVHGHRSHLLVYSAVVTLLLERGHNVTVVSTRGLENLPADCASLRQVRVPAGSSSGLPGQNAFAKLRWSLARIEQASSFLAEPTWLAFLAEDAHYDLMLLGYLFNDYLLGVAAHFSCPAAVIWPGQPIGHIHRLIGNPEARWLVAQPYDSHQRTGLAAVALGAFEKLVELLTLEAMERVYNEHFHAERYPTFHALRANVSLVLCSHHSLSEGPIAPQVPGIIEIGGLRNYLEARDSTKRTEFTVDAKNLIFLSFGTRIKWSTLPPNATAVFVDAFRRLPAFTVLWTYDGNCTALTAAASNVLCDQWWPQTELLGSPQLRLFITRGGKGSISEALYHGVPIVGIPFIGDQRPNIARLAQRGLALQLDLKTLSAAQLVDAIVDLTHRNSTSAAAAKRFALLYRDRPLPPDVVAVFWLEYVLRHKGAPHMRSPLLQLTALQYHALDVYAALIAALAALVVACNWLERRLTP